MPQDKLKIISNGIFFSLLSYRLPTYGSVSGLFRYAEGNERYLAMSKDDSHQIQVIMNVVLRAITKLPFETSVNVLIEQSGFLSFHQICAYSTLKLIHKIIVNKKPTFILNRFMDYDKRVNRPRRENLAQTAFKLSVAREGFMSQAAKLYYSLPEDIQLIQSPGFFKTQARSWVKANIPIYM